MVRIDHTTPPNTDYPAIWHLHGHYNDAVDAKVQDAAIKMFEELNDYLEGQGHAIYFSKCREAKNGPHHPGSWDIFVEPQAIGDATLWAAMNRPKDVPIFYHPVVPNPDTGIPGPAEEFFAHTQQAVVFGMPTAQGGEKIDWNEQIDWEWVKAIWADKMG